MKKLNETEMSASEALEQSMQEFDAEIMEMAREQGQYVRVPEDTAQFVKDVLARIEKKKIK